MIWWTLSSGILGVEVMVDIKYNESRFIPLYHVGDKIRFNDPNAFGPASLKKGVIQDVEIDLDGIPCVIVKVSDIRTIRLDIPSLHSELNHA